MSSTLVQLVDIPQHGDARGGLSVAEMGGALPFPVRRVYWIHGTKPSVSRGFHAHKKLRQLCVCVAGSVRMNLFDGRREESVVLDSSAKGLLIGPGLWREMHDFSPDCVLMVFADAEYDEADYIRDRQEFIHHVHYGPPMTVRCALIDLPTRRDERGALAFVETGKQLPFEALRQFHLFDLRAGVARGGHAHKTCHQFLIASAGSFRVTTDDGKAKQEWILCSPAQGLHVPPDYWVELVPDSDSAVLSVLASHGHDESDYFRDRDQFIRHAAG